MEVNIICYGTNTHITCVADLIEREEFIKQGSFKRDNIPFKKKTRQLYLDGINFPLNPQETYAIRIVGEDTPYFGRVISFDTLNGFQWIMYFT